MFGQTQTTTYTVGGMTCGHCEKRVEQAVSQTTKVKKVKANHTLGTVEVAFKKNDPPDDKSISETITALGFTVTAE